MLYSKKGDNGKTDLIGSQRVFKNNPKVDLLGDLDELNSVLGLCRFVLSKDDFYFINQLVTKTVLETQKVIFTIQAEVAGSTETVSSKSIKKLEKFIDSAEKEISPITSFIVPGASEVSSFIDLARTVTRRVERKIINLDINNKVNLNKETKIYINRLSDFLFVLARLINHKFGIKEEYQKND
jgi:cob(I)alamin adenosyltransferase